MWKSLTVMLLQCFWDACFPILFIKSFCLYFIVANYFHSMVIIVCQYILVVIICFLLLSFSATHFGRWLSLWSRLQRQIDHFYFCQSYYTLKTSTVRFISSIGWFLFTIRTRHQTAIFFLESGRFVKPFSWWQYLFNNLK